MFSFLELLGLRKPPVLYIHFNLSRKSYTKEIIKQPTVNDRDYVLLALLIYARVVKITPLANVSDRNIIYRAFIDINEGVKDGTLSWYGVEKVVEFYFTHFDNDHTWKIKYNGMGIRASSVNKDVEKYIYLSFLHSLSQINQDNKRKLVDGFAMLSKSFLIERPSSIEAISIPNAITANLFDK
jgi:hypothetical protein